MKTVHVGFLAAFALACSTPGEEVGAGAQAEVKYSLASAPLTLGPIWHGSAVELLAADAYYNCTMVTEYTLGGSSALDRRRPFDSGGDRFLDNLTTLMVSAAWDSGYPPDVNHNFDERWYDARGVMLGAYSAVQPQDILTYSGHPVPGMKFANNASPTSMELALDTDFRTGPVNLCMAQELRRHSPGSAANTGLFLSEAEQRELLEIVRERSQVAMLQYALFASVYAAGAVASTSWAGQQARLGEISTWLKNLPNYQIEKMGHDFATAVQLNEMATEEMAELLARSRSGRQPFGRIPADRSDGFWGASSWYQREMALFFGGDPLAMEANPDGGAPWKGLVPTPGYGTTGGTWPDTSLLQSSHTELLEPQPQLLLQMARQKGLLKLILAAPNPCDNVDKDASATSIYNAVEAKLRVEGCEIYSGGQCQGSVPSSDDAYWLLTRYGITRAHASTMVAWLSEAVTFPATACPADQMLGQRGALTFASTLPFSSGPAAALSDPSEPATVVFAPGSPATIEIKPQAGLAARDARFVGGLYSRMAPLYFADVRDITAQYDVGILGFNGVFGGWNWSTVPERKRIMGAVPAHAVVRRLLSAATVAAPSNAYVAAASKALALATAAGGGPALSLRPLLDQGNYWWGVGYTSASNRPFRPSLTVDPATSDIKCDGAVEQCTLYAINGDADAADLAANPSTVLKRNGTKVNIASIAYAIDGGNSSVGVRSTSSTALYGGSVIEFASLPLGANANGNENFFNFVLERRRGGVHFKWDLLASRVRIQSYYAGDAVSDGQELAFGGSLGTMAARANQPLLRNPAEPAYDGFGWETHWVPPLTAAFLGGDPSQTSVEPMLKIAEQSAADAEEAINTAVAGLLERQKDLAQVAAAQAKSSQAIKQERDGLCGPGATENDCAVASQRVKSTISVSQWYSLPGPTGLDCSAPTGLAATMDCLLQKAMQGIETTEVTLATPVDAVKTTANAPGFHQYDGGSLQSAFIEQWRAVNALGGKIRALQSVKVSAAASISAADAEFENINAVAAYKCSVGMAIAALAGVSTGFASATFNPAPLMAAMSDCALSVLGLGPAAAKDSAAEMAAFSSLAVSLADVTDYLAAIQQSSAKIESLAAQAKMGQARASLDADLAKSTSVTSFPLYRNFRDADLWRARATVESARRYALAARRALEARYVVDLTRLDQKETFVAAPSIWADDIYGYDLSLPSSVGLTLPTTDQKDPNAIYKSVIKDYVANLRGFINGYAASRPSAVAQDDIDVINLSGFVPFGNGSEAPGAWQLLCGTNWVSLDTYKTAPGGGWNCSTGATAGPKATRARVGFTLDPWGRLNGAIGNEPYSKRYNTRWGKVALNVVGTGVKDCSLAADPLACYANSTIRYNLTHVTPTWTTDYDGLWREQDMPLGQIEGGKGLAVELFLNPLKDGWNTQFISAVARTEYLFRPVGGAYNLEFEVTPEVVLQRIERMQLLVGTSAWVKQK